MNRTRVSALSRLATGLLVLVTLTLQASASAARATTAPGRDVDVNVNITDHGISIAEYAPIDSENGQPTMAAVYHLTRGLTAHFIVRNLGKKPHAFATMGKKTRELAPGRTARFAVPLLTRGTFRYESPADKGKPTFRGFLTVE